MCVLLHGDAAFAGQGVVPETFMLSRLEGYSVAGTVHIIVNNQVGFTAESTTGRSSRYASDIGKIVHCPVLHVNAEDVEATVAAARLATEYRNRYGKDVIIDLIGYRKHGFPSIYANKLKEAGLLSDKGLKELKESLTKHLESEFEASKQFTNETGSGPLEEWAFQGNWNGMRQSTEEDLSSDANLATGVPVEDLKSIGRESIRIPEGFSRHVRLEKWAESRVKLLEGPLGLLCLPPDGVVDWPTAEDSMRGTFSQRHYSFFDQAQFGDFANGAQIIIDNFITSSESKWLRQTGLVMLLPHGYDGAGPEHSTGRPERFLQLVNTQVLAETCNLIVANLTTPANYFHFLR
ncbi:odhA, partial [Symbiodinium sp. KB8]